ncbi:hypothetical protein B0T21DRAFT_368407 [Apiosordaria backusii]|uniref:Secreted protein n=1 Tax=Apiosordaria backusii TaxID=314023 RepID=A0AA40BK62_9PEZI|nr:hypothetical protein B0T21DRAFT_368407 [Apiosordaria backusii]
MSCVVCVMILNHTSACLFLSFGGPRQLQYHPLSNSYSLTVRHGASGLFARPCCAACSCKTLLTLHRISWKGKTENSLLHRPLPEIRDIIHPRKTLTWA